MRTLNAERTEFDDGIPAIELTLFDDDGLVQETMVLTVKEAQVLLKLLNKQIKISELGKSL